LERFDEIGNRQRLRFTMRKLVAAMSVYQVPKILPFDPDDFNRYEKVTVLHSNSS
jgi:hypothetical protein